MRDTITTIMNWENIKEQFSDIKLLIIKLIPENEKEILNYIPYSTYCVISSLVKNEENKEIVIPSNITNYSTEHFINSEKEKDHAMGLLLYKIYVLCEKIEELRTIDDYNIYSEKRIEIQNHKLVYALPDYKRVKVLKGIFIYCENCISENSSIPYTKYFIDFRNQIKLDLENTENRLNPSPNESLVLDDLNTVRANEKIVLLHKLGVLDYLRDKEPFNTSTNSLANILSDILSENRTTLQSYLNPIFSNNNIEKNNPLLSTKAVERANQKLTLIGFKQSE